MTLPSAPVEHWENWIGDYDRVCPVYRPKNKAELLATVELAVREGRRIRAVGSGHSHSRCGQPDELAVDISAIEGTFDQVEWLKRDVPGLDAGEHLVRVRAGTTLKELARLHLHKMAPPLGLLNAGTFDGQTLAGAISTGTHGTGVGAGSLADMVVSMDIVTVTRSEDGAPDVRMRRIEPTIGVTDPGAFERDQQDHGMVLEQDDALFYSMVVAYGCMGIAYAYTLRVRDEYWLREETEFVEWGDLANELGEETRVPGGTAPAVADSADHVWFLLNVAETQGRNRTDAPACFVVRRWVVDAVAKPKRWSRAWPPERRSDFFSELAQDVANLDPMQSHDNVGKRIRNHYIGNVVEKPAFKGDQWSSVSYIVHRREQDDRAPDQAPEVPPPALSIEIAVSAMDVVEAIETALECVGRSAMFFISPWGVRFTPSSPHYLSPAHGRPTAWIEVVFALPTPLFSPDRTRDTVRDTIAKPELQLIEQELCYAGRLAGRPHLGKHNTVNRERLAQLYPELDTWLTAYTRFNSFSTFNSMFTEQLGLAAVAPSQENSRRAWLTPVLRAMMT